MSKSFNKKYYEGIYESIKDLNFNLEVTLKFDTYTSIDACANRANIS